MKNPILAAFAALSLTAAIAPVANTTTHSTFRSGLYENTGHGP
jgi:hypothetical protein